MRRLTLLVIASGLLASCAAEPLPAEPTLGDDPFKGTISEELARSGRWTLSASAQSASASTSVRYDGAPAWRGTAGCTGTFTSGARELGDYLVANFSGASRYEGYACRQNTADTSQTSMHGTGRAIDLFVPLAGGQADNDRGDPIANWLVEHADEIGVQLIIWDRTVWNGSRSGTKDRQYTGPHPHHDHLHIEINEDAAARSTRWFTDTGSSDPGAGDPGAGDPGTGTGTGTGTGEEPMPEPSGDCDTCAYARDGECDDGRPGAITSLCASGTDCSDCGSTGSTAPPAPADMGGCTDTCRYAADGECDDGGAGAVYSVCALGTDCSDCGPRSGTTGSGTPHEDPLACYPMGSEMCAGGGTCCDGLSCRRGVTFGTRCCAEAYQACDSSADCCGSMICSGGVCACRGAGSSCVAGGDCCSGSCSSGVCD